MGGKFEKVAQIQKARTIEELRSFLYDEDSFICWFARERTVELRKNTVYSLEEVLG